MTVTTQPCAPEPALYRRLALTELFRRLAWVNAAGIALLAYGVWAGRWPLVALVVAWAAGTFGYAYWRLGKTLSDPANAVMFAPRAYAFDADGFTTTMADGAARTHRYADLVRAVREADHFRLYVSTDGFLLVPFAAFATEADRAQVDRWLPAAR